MCFFPLCFGIVVVVVEDAAGCVFGLCLSAGCRRWRRLCGTLVVVVVVLVLVLVLVLDDVVFIGGQAPGLSGPGAPAR